MDDPADSGVEVAPTRRLPSSSGGGFFRNFTPELVRWMLGASVLGFIAANCLASVLYMTVAHTSFAVFFCLALALVGFALVLSSSQRRQVSRNTGQSKVPPMMHLISLLGAASTMAASIVGLLVHFKVPGGSETLRTVFINILSVGTCYVIGIILTDVLNRFLRGTRKLQAWQLYSIALSSLLLGITGGVLFGLVDVEDHVARYGYEQWIQSVVGALVGALVGHSSYHAKDEAMLIEFDPISMDDDME